MRWPVTLNRLVMQKCVVTQRDQSQNHSGYEAISIALPPVLRHANEWQQRDAPEQRSKWNDGPERRAFDYGVVPVALSVLVVTVAIFGVGMSMLLVIITVAIVSVLVLRVDNDLRALLWQTHHGRYEIKGNDCRNTKEHGAARVVRRLRVRHCKSVRRHQMAGPLSACRVRSRAGRSWVWSISNP